MHLHKAMEDYLKAILILQNRNGTVRSLDVAELLHVSKPSVSRAMKLLRESGFLTMGADKQLFLTVQGREAAELIYEKHSVLKTCLVSIGVDPDVAEKEACGMEHIIGDESYEKIRSFLDAASNHDLKTSKT